MWKKRHRRLKIWKEQNGRCYLCGDLTWIAETKDVFFKLNLYQFPLWKMATIDHIIPLSKGGKHKMANLAVACKQCNSEKGDNIL